MAEANRLLAGLALLGALLCPPQAGAAGKHPASATGECPAGMATAPDGGCSRCAASWQKGQEACGDARKGCAKRCEATYQKCLRDPHALRCDAVQDKCTAACDVTRSSCFAAKEKTFLECRSREAPRKR